MKILPTALAARPWLLVVVAFLVLIAAWTTIITISAHHPTGRLSPAEEEALLRKLPSRP